MKVSIDVADFHLNNSQPVAIPTETVWGLAACLYDEAAIRKIFFLKGRPLQNPLIIHLCTPDFLFSCCTEELPGLDALINAFWPGGLTVVVPVDEHKVPSLVRAGLSTAAFRIPDHRDTLALIERTGPLVAPSANRSGSPSATKPQHIEKDFGDWLPILATRTYCRHGVESTILIWKEGVWHIGRLGAIRITDIAKVLGYTPSHHTSEEDCPLCPGQLFRHYAPQARLTLSTEPWKSSFASQYDGVLGFSDRTYPGATRCIVLGNSRKPQEAAKTLYASLRDLDRFQLQSVFVDIDVPTSSDWLTVLDRLQKASRI
jgi:L-threonylcarbamoyladenylate synthase